MVVNRQFLIGRSNRSNSCTPNVGISTSGNNGAYAADEHQGFE
jgi:hypothetical protein